ncbi:MAG: hypothetical protein ACI865_002875 [Flavobacteriaceae bacterium]|jgi:hypothetical protein
MEGEWQLPIEYSGHASWGDLLYFHKNDRSADVYHTITEELVHHANIGQPLDYVRGYYKMEKNGKWGLMNVITKEMLIPYTYDFIGDYYLPNDRDIDTYGYVKVTKDKKFGIVSIYGKTILPCKGMAFRRVRFGKMA